MKQKEPAGRLLTGSQPGSDSKTFASIVCVHQPSYVMPSSIPRVLALVLKCRVQ